MIDMYRCLYIPEITAAIARVKVKKIYSFQNRSENELGINKIEGKTSFLLSLFASCVASLQCCYIVHGALNTAVQSIEHDAVFLTLSSLIDRTSGMLK